MTTKRMQEKLVPMLKAFHEFCVKHGLRYYISGGTCLGAVRHQGFIPWDDDIDVGMPRVDYNRFIELSKTEKLAEHYVVEKPLDNEDYVYAFIKIYDTTTTLVENTANRLKRGVFLDVFPLDGAGNSLQESKKSYKKVNMQVNFLYAKVCAIRATRKFYKNAIIAVFRLLPISKKGLIKKIIRLSEQKSYDDYDWIINYVGGSGMGECLKKQHFGEPKLYNFEGLQVYGPNDADAYLTNLYGDYMKLPPEDKRVTNHDFIEIDFEKGYLDKE